MPAKPAALEPAAESVEPAALQSTEGSAPVPTKPKPPPPSRKPSLPKATSAPKPALPATAALAAVPSQPLATIPGVSGGSDASPNHSTPAAAARSNPTVLKTELTFQKLPDAAKKPPLPGKKPELASKPRLTKKPTLEPKPAFLKPKPAVSSKKPAIVATPPKAPSTNLPALPITTAATAAEKVSAPALGEATHKATKVPPPKPTARSGQRVLPPSRTVFIKPPTVSSVGVPKPARAPRDSNSAVVAAAGTASAAAASEIDHDSDDDEEYLDVADEGGAFSESNEDEYKTQTSDQREVLSVSDPTVELPLPVRATTDVENAPAPSLAEAASASPPPPVVPPRAPAQVFAGDDLELKRAVRKLLRAEGIGLWEAPYSLDDGRSSMPSDLADRYASSIVTGASRVFDALETLRISSRKKQKLSIPPAGEAPRTYEDAIKEVATDT